MKEVEVIKARNDLQTRTRGKTIELMRVGAYCRVSTDSADQLNSYKSQVAYYTDLIKKNQEWVLADHDKRMNDPLFLTLPAVSFLRI